LFQSKNHPFFMPDMIYYLIFTGFVIIAYTVIICKFCIGWQRLPEISTSHNSRIKVFISVIIPFRNEEENLPGLIQNISEQQFPHHLMEVVLVNDHSTDNGIEKLEALRTEHHWLKVISSAGRGKKEALKRGISSATGEVIVTTDADCHFWKDWLQTIAETYFSLNPDMIVMPVGMEAGPNWLAKFQQNDYLALQMVTAGALGIDKPIISSGANLAFRKKAFLEASKLLHGENYLSGDDVFLLHTFKSLSFRIIYLKSVQAMVKTNPANSLKQFLFQRMRWGGKSKGYKDPFALFTALTILITNSTLAILPFLSLISVSALWSWLVFMLIKIIVDRCLVNSGKDFFSVTTSLPMFLSFSFVYPFYILMAGTGSLFFKERWKDRTGR
jgi:cellulose synthase/poly-beta-1,6-N-acetylglucosamine synthase-like glycosyltransferase